VSIMIERERYLDHRRASSLLLSRPADYHAAASEKRDE
jgi:hypothetical protein